MAADNPNSTDLCFILKKILFSFLSIKDLEDLASEEYEYKSSLNFFKTTGFYHF